MDRFIDRQKELDRLKALFNSVKPELIIVYGRRRIGKTTLLIQATKEREDSIYFQAVETTKKDQLESFIDTAKEKYPKITQLSKEWTPILKHLIQKNAVSFSHLKERACQ